MALKTFNPTTPSQRNLVIVNRSELWKGKPVKKLTEGLTKTGVGRPAQWGNGDLGSWSRRGVLWQTNRETRRCISLQQSHTKRFEV